MDLRKDHSVLYFLVVLQYQKIESF
jgi:hypothetical protein